MKHFITAAALLLTAAPAIATPWVQLCTSGGSTSFALDCRFGHDPEDYIQYKLVQTTCTMNTTTPFDSITWYVTHSLEPTWGTPKHAVGHTWRNHAAVKGCATGYFTWRGLLRATLRQVIDSVTGKLVPPPPYNIQKYDFSASIVKGWTGVMCGAQK